MTDIEIEQRLKACVAQERKIAAEIIGLIREADHRRLYLNGFASLFDWLTQNFGYSESAAYRRIQAARFVEFVPELAQKLETGQTNLTVLAQAQTAMKREEKRTGEQMPLERKQQIAEAIEGKTSKQAQRVLAEIFPSSTPKEYLRAINKDEYQLSVVVVPETVQVLHRAKDQLSHAKPEATWSDAVQHVVKIFGQKLAAQFASAAAKPRGKQAVRKMLLERAGHRCEYVDRATGRRCSSSYQLEVDHVRSRAIGGGDEVDNLRILCRPHNILMAERNLGLEKMRPFRRARGHASDKNSKDEGPVSS